MVGLMAARPSSSVAVKGTIKAPVGLGQYLNSPAVSTNKTVDENSTANLSDMIDNSQHIVNTASNLGLVAPTTHKPSAGAATAVVKSNKSGWLVALLVVAAIVVISKA